MIETTTVLASISAASGGSASGAVCGFTAMTRAATGADDRRFGLMRTPRLPSALIACDGCGSSTTIFFGVSSRREPAVQHGAAHLAGADQHERAGNGGEGVCFATWPCASSFRLVSAACPDP